MAFVKAVKSNVWLKVAFIGPSGSGKTYSALILSRGCGFKKVALIDTENNSASLYADRFDFDTLSLTPPFTIKKYREAMWDAVQSKYDVVISDSITHFWAGEGGLLEKKELKDRSGGNQWTNWAEITKEHESFKSAILQSPIHVFATARVKQEYAMEEVDNKKKIVKLGTAVIQRDGLEYEFTTVFNMGMNHAFEASKDRTSIFDGRCEILTEDHGIELMNWLRGSNQQQPSGKMVTSSDPMPSEKILPAKEEGAPSSTGSEIEAIRQAYQAEQQTKAKGYDPGNEAHTAALRKALAELQLSAEKQTEVEKAMIGRGFSDLGKVVWEACK